MASKLYRILLEAEEDEYEDNPDGEDTSDTTDYTEEVEEISDEGEVSEEEEPEDTGYEDNPDGSSDDETTDYTDESGEGESEGENGEESMDEEEPQEENSPGETKQRLMLIKDYMNLYEFINDMIEKLNSNTNINLIIQQVINRVNENLRQIREQLYDYITCDFKKDSYINSLTIYNYFIKAIKVNSEMIIKISQYDSKNEQNSKGKPMKSKVTAKNKK